MSSLISRRSLLKSAVALAIAAPLAQACAPKTEAPAAPAAPAAPKAAVPAKPAPKAKIPMSIATYASVPNEWQRIMSRGWAEKNPDVELNIDEVPYGEMNKKQLALMATGNLWDVSFSGIKWYPFSIVKGAFLPLDDYVAAKDPGMDDFIPTAILSSSWDQKLYGLPYLLHPGNVALVATNLDMVKEKGVAPPTDDTTFDEYVEIIAACQDLDNQVFGTNYMPNNFYDCAPYRSWGSDVIDAEGKKFLVGVEPKATEAAKFITEMRTKHHVAPFREEAEGLTFQAGKMVSRMAGTYAVGAVKQEVGGKFEIGFTLHPKGPAGVAGWQVFVETMSVYSKTKNPDRAYDLTVALTSEEAGIEAVTNHGYNPSGRKSIWANPAVDEQDPIYRRAAAWMAEVDGPFPMPYNVRFAELQDTWNNNARDVFYGEVPFEEGFATTAKRCQAVMDLDRP